MIAFEYANPSSLDEAVSLLGATWGETEVLAGGTDLVSSLKQDITRPKLVVSLRDVPGLAGVNASSDAVTIGAMTRLHAVAQDATVQKEFPALAAAINNIGSSQMTRMGSAGGELLQRPRCWYFRNGFGLLGQQDGKALVPDGDNRYHAAYDNKGPAYFVSPSSMAPALVALGASVTLQGPKGERTIPVAELFRKPDSAGDREFAMSSNEILTAITVPRSGMRNALYEIRPRQGLDWPMVAAAVAFSYSGGKAGQDAKVVLGHVAPTPYIAEGASKALAGNSVESAIDGVVSKVEQGSSPLSRNGYKVIQAKTAVRRAIAQAIA